MAEVGLRSHVTIVLVLSVFPSFRFVSDATPTFERAPLASPSRELFNGTNGEGALSRWSYVDVSGGPRTPPGFPSV